MSSPDAQIEKPKLYHLLAFRLSVWYGATVAAAAVLCVVTFYVAVVSVMRHKNDSYLAGEARECGRILGERGRGAMLEELNREIDATGSDDVFYRVRGPGGAVVAASDLSTWSDVAASMRGTAPGAEDGAVAYEDWHGGARHARVRVIDAPLRPDLTLQMGLDVSGDDPVVRTSRNVVVFAMVGIVAAAVVIGWTTARRTLAGVAAVTRTATEIAGGANLQSRVPVAGRGDEIDQLAAAFNGMLQRISGLVGGMRQTNDNIAHELRSPITRMRGLAEASFLHEASAEDYRHIAADTVEECDRLLAVINTMLDIGEAEAGISAGRLGPIDVGATAANACELYGPVADDRGVRIALDAAPGAWVRGDVQQFQRVVANLLDNAIKYSPDGQAVDVTVRRDRGRICLEVGNAGAGISEKDLPHVFERFYRGQVARTQRGNGLGLSLARAVVRAMGGEIRIRSQPGVRTEVAVELPEESRERVGEVSAAGG